MKQKNERYPESERIRAWYRINKRDLPWRNTSDPYRIWISEVILQQTRVAQGLDYYYRFIERFPDVRSLADASQEEVLKYWQGLGYYSRARNLHEAAQDIRQRYDGVFPSSYEAIRTLKGIGEYTAAAIASFTWNLPYPAIDGNVIRVLGRLFAVQTPADSGKGIREYRRLATLVMPPRHVARWLNNVPDMLPAIRIVFLSNSIKQKRAIVSFITFLSNITRTPTYINATEATFGKDCLSCP